MAEDLANLMAHNVSTAKKHYRLVEKKKVAAKTSQKLAKMIRYTNDAKESDYMKDSKRSQNDSISKHTFTDEQLSEIRRVFKFEIVTKDMSMDTVRAKVQTNYALENCNPRHVYDKIRSEWRVSSVSKIQERELPREKESLIDKIRRMHMGDESTNTISPTEQSISAAICAIPLFCAILIKSTL